MALGKKLINEYPDYFSFVPAAYDQEHSYEVQLPFLQYIFKFQIPNFKFKILPLVFGNVNPIEVGNILFELSKKEEMFFIVSSDLSHFMEYSNAVKTDEETLQDFVDKNIDKIVHEADACGLHPRLALTQIAIKAKRTPELLKYLNSGDTAGDKSRVV
jgi:AmmeMemoRadiSam system protein B